MSKDKDAYVLPVGPSSLCFNTNEFVKKSFSIDQFLQSHRKKANLETIRDDLGIYLKVLRSAMIELINKDYADFVNLSSNLIGLDKEITGIQIPLGQLKEEVLQVKLNLEEAMADLSNCLEQRRQLRMRKRSLQSLARVQSSLNKLTGLLKLGDGNENVEQLDSDLIERAASEYNQLQFSMSKCETELVPSHVKKVEQIRNFLASSLSGMFLESVRSRSVEGMARCLRVYVTLDRMSDVEDLFRTEVVAPALHDVINENSLQSDPRGIQGIYARVLNFIDSDMKELLELTTNTVRMPAIKGYNFLVNSYWPEVENRLETYLSSIFAPGNPEMFYQRYCETVKFLEQLERYCCTHTGVKTLHAHPQYVAFLQRWNLPVYFQIRFQEIGATLESVTCQGNVASMLDKGLGEDRTHGFHLLPTCTAWKCLLKCWSDGIFLSQLTHRFWKLSLQIIARYYTWIGEALTENWPNLQSSGDNATSNSNNTTKLQFLVYLHTDIQHLIERLPEFLAVVLQKLGSLSSPIQEKLSSSLNESDDRLQSRLPVVTQFILGEVSSQSLTHLRQVSDIPRLFRRTNREMPTRPCAYVLAALAPPLSFHNAQQLIVKPQVLQHWLMLIFSAITQQFYSSVDDVLTSVQKTEESLRRLKKIRDRSAPTSTTEVKGSGDDDKIRQQLALDVYSFCEGIESVGISQNAVEKLEELIALVDSARTKTSSRS